MLLHRYLGGFTFFWNVNYYFSLILMTIYVVESLFCSFGYSLDQLLLENLFNLQFRFTTGKDFLKQILMLNLTQRQSLI